MMVTGSRLRQIGWAVVLLACVCVFLALSLRVHAVKSQVLLAERHIIELRRENMMLETEFETRASQRQLANWNVVEFGYQAPRADQYLQNRMQLARFGSPRGPLAPEPIRVARLDYKGKPANKAPMASPLTGKPLDQSRRDRADSPAQILGAIGDIVADVSPVGKARSQVSRSISAEIAE